MQTLTDLPVPVLFTSDGGHFDLHIKICLRQDEGRWWVLGKVDAKGSVEFLKVDVVEVMGGGFGHVRDRELHDSNYREVDSIGRVDARSGVTGDDRTGDIQTLSGWVQFLAAIS